MGLKIDKQKEKRLLETIEVLTKRIEYAIVEAQMDPDLRDINIVYGNHCPPFNGHRLDIWALARVSKQAERKIAQRKIIQRIN